eukprot:1182063-Prorocentrum_minimum.AAC.1
MGEFSCSAHIRARPPLPLPCYRRGDVTLYNNIASFYESSCANNGKDALNTPETLHYIHSLVGPGRSHLPQEAAGTVNLRRLDARDNHHRRRRDERARVAVQQLVAAALPPPPP